MQRARWIALALALSVGCHHQASGARGGASNNVITQEEIEAAGASNIYDLIARLHANYLADRGRISIQTNTHSRAVVFLNDQEYGIPETMRNIPPDRVAQVRYYPGTEALSRFGAQYGGGVIQLISRNQ